MFDQLYQEIILDHASHPRNRGKVPSPDATVEADNPLCGDEITLTVKAGEDDSIEAIQFEGNACAICTASTSMMTLKCKGQSADTIRKLSAQFQRMLTAENKEESCPGDLKVFAGVREFPMRVKCATLPWHALDEAIRQIESDQRGKSVHVDVSVDPKDD
jgi:nitrogen fixation NifU-like protein